MLLPRLESLGQVAEAESPRRLLTIVNHLSFYQPELIPEAAGAFDQPPPLLAELSDHFEHLKVYSGLDNPAVQNGFGHTPCALRSRSSAVGVARDDVRDGTKTLGSATEQNREK